MTPIAHLSSGIWVYVLYASRFEYNRPLLVASLLGSMAPDIDGLFGKKMKDHRRTIFHTPILWLFLFLISYLVYILTNYAGMIYFNAFTFGALVHLFLDWISARTSGIMLFYPFSEKLYSLYPTNSEIGNVSVLPTKDTKYKQFWLFYLKNKKLLFIEIIVILSPLLLIIWYY